MSEIVSTIIAYSFFPLLAVLLGLLIKYFFAYSNLLISALTIIVLFAFSLLGLSVLGGKFGIALLVLSGLLFFIVLILNFILSRKQNKKLEKKIKYISATGIFVANLLLLFLSSFIFIFSFFTAYIGAVGLFIIPAVITFLILIFFHITAIKRQKEKKMNKKPFSLYVNIVGIVVFLVFSIWFNLEFSKGRMKMPSNMGINSCQKENPELSIINLVQRIIYPGSVNKLDKDNTNCKSSFNKTGAKLEQKIKQKESAEKPEQKEQMPMGNISDTEKKTKNETTVSPEGFDDSGLENKSDVKIEKK